MKPAIFLDLDGVLVDFVSAASNLHDIEPEPYNYKFWRHEMSDRAFWARIRSRGSVFWKNAPKYSWADQLVGMCESQAWRVHFVSSVDPRNPSAAQGKVEWLEKHFPERSRRFILTKKKYLLAGPTRLLIDDTFKHCKNWNGWGGRALLMPQPWTRTWEPGLKDGGRISFLRDRLNHTIRKINDDS